ncbi:uncharacterized protein Hqrw_2064A [Haloquadratum walsbyi C23]|uniref:Uncharacterized protein n=1 Tax=Haloquadratum walsbyi (strain DSM 16854 / JCM 12705 / C23) TaxID=768065 RepID=A0A0C7U2V1_HALWC|nr:uncharacterized protein Hqrw_2064A [Haloquadratum walsbyi C23]
MIMPVITTILNYPDAVGEARNVEPHEAGLEPREKPANIAPLPIHAESPVDKI